MTIRKYMISLAAAVILTPAASFGQDVLSLEKCLSMAIENNRTLEQARLEKDMAGYDRKIARANYTPNISASGAYIYNDKNISLISDNMSEKLTGAGTMAQGAMNDFLAGLQQAIATNPAAAAEYMQSPMWQTVIGALQQTDISTALNQLGSEIDDAFHLDIHNIFAAGVSLTQPIYMGGKIVAANRIAALAEELAQARYDKELQDLTTSVRQAYWQIVSISAKKRLAEDYSSLLKNMERDVKLSVANGMATKSDALSIRVKVNEADMMKTKATNGLVLAKMLLCKEIGIALDSPITLEDENSTSVPVPEMLEQRPMDEILADRPETKSLELATRIYEQQIRVARADMIPKVALTANYLLTNPSAKSGFRNSWEGMFNVGVAVSVPICHGMEATRKTQKAKTEAMLYRSKYEDACDLVNLQVTQLRKQQEEALEKIGMAESNLDSAEENLRTASVGVKNGVVTTNTALAAHSAWLEAHSERIDAGIELQMVNAELRKAEGR